uniref:Uncharacterized protein n=1 Tax=Ananas comosus var. bracteatus TaxID=296719 RepID=A0A6V7NXQ3_ANACO|nr:unnamed protein product [Ananas comosus var. bracteatus]
MVEPTPPPCAPAAMRRACHLLLDLRRRIVAVPALPAVALPPAPLNPRAAWRIGSQQDTECNNRSTRSTDTECNNRPTRSTDMECNNRPTRTLPTLCPLTEALYPQAEVWLWRK